MCKRTVVCDQKETFCIYIQTPYRKKSLSSIFLFNIVENRFISGVLRCADTACRLVKKIVYIFRCSKNFLPVHNHLIFNAVSFADHKHYHSNKRSYHFIRRTSDRICKEHGLSVIVPGQDKGKSYIEHQAERTGSSSKA